MCYVLEVITSTFWFTCVTNSLGSFLTFYLFVSIIAIEAIGVWVGGELELLNSSLGLD